jgi:hypothetical protein
LLICVQGDALTESKLKSVIVTIAIALALVVPSSAQWVKKEKKNLITGKTEITYLLESEAPEKATLMLLCDGGAHPYEYNQREPLQLHPGFQVNRSGGNESRMWHEFLLWVPARTDSKTSRFVGALGGDLDSLVTFNQTFTAKIVTSKEVVLELPEFAGPLHQMLFKMDGPPMPLDAKGKLLMCQ